MQPILEARGIRKQFGAVEALRGAEITVMPSEIVAVVGDNGAGKSTLIKVLSGVHQPDAGEIQLDGQAVSFATPRAARAAGIETIYQDLALADDLDVSANIFLGREPVKRWLGLLPIIDNGRMRAEVNSLLDRVESHIADPAVKVRDLSGGQRQAVSIARALYWDARIVIMDEPTAALAVMETRNVLRLARQLAEHSVGVIYVGHNLVEVLDVADRVYVMYRGSVVFEARSSETTQDELVKYMTGFSKTQEASGDVSPRGDATQAGA